MTRPLTETVVGAARTLIKKGRPLKEVARKLGVAQNSLAMRVRAGDSRFCRPCSACGQPVIRGGWCKPCKNAYTRKWRAANPEKVKAKNRSYYYSDHGKKCRQARYLRSFSITSQEYKELFRAHNGVCAICGRQGENNKYKPLCVDHNHVTNRVRGLLCRKCNSAIGLMEDDPGILRKAIEYLERTSRG